MTGQVKENMEKQENLVSSSELISNIELQPWKDEIADVSNVRPSWEQIQEFWVVLLMVEKWKQKNSNKLVEWKKLDDST